MRRWVWLSVLAGLAAGCELVAGLQDRQLETDASVDGTTPDVGPACTSPRAECTTGDASVCVDLSTDINHCGGCGRTCSVPDAGAFDATSGNPDPGIPSFEAGADAAYVRLPSAGCEGGTCDLQCAGGTELCGSLCYDTQSFHDHCGSCNTACDAGDWCHGGACCGPGTESCGDAGCIDVVGNASNCGACGNECPDAAPYCSSGACTPGISVTTVCGKSNPSGILCSGDCSTNHAQYADAYCKLAGYTSAVSYTVLTSTVVQCLYYMGGATVPTSCSQILGPGSYGLNTTCDAIENLVCR